jgi:hypothetical protein
MLFIEKADICEVLTPFAKKYGVALVNTVGFLTEYGQDEEYWCFQYIQLNPAYRGVQQQSI